MKILYIITQADGGGAQAYTLSLAKHFGGSIAAGSEAKKLFDDAKNLQIKTYQLQHLKRNINPWHDFLAVWEIRELIRLLQPDIVHLNSSKAGVLGSFACMGLKTKVIFTAHGFIFNEPMSFSVKSFYLALEKTASSYRDYIITVSEADHKSALDNNLIDPKKIQTVHNGIGVINFLSSTEAKAALGLSKEKIIVGTIANFYKTKGLDVLIQSVAMLDDELKNRCQFIIIGSGREFENCQTLINNLNLGPQFVLPGNVEKASTYLKAFDLFVLPSRKEGLPYTILEAMQAGLPIIATNVGGNAEAIGDAGILVDPENPKQLAENIAKLVSDNGLRANLGQKAFERSKIFTEEKMLEETKNIYEKILQRI